jgi:hypothetical protein
MSIRARRSSFRNLLVVAVGIIGTATLAIGLTILWLRTDAIFDASRDAGNLAVVLAEQTANSVQSIDLVLTEIIAPDDIASSHASATTRPNLWIARSVDLVS